MITINNVYRLLGLGILRLTCSGERVVKHLCPKGLNIGTRTGVIKKTPLSGAVRGCGVGDVGSAKNPKPHYFFVKVTEQYFPLRV